MNDKQCPFCGEEIHSVTLRRITPNVVACRTCGDKVLPILHSVNDSIVRQILEKQEEDDGSTLNHILIGMMDDELNVLVPEQDRRIMEQILR